MARVLAVSVWAHRRRRTVCPASVQTHTVAGDAHGLHALHDWVFPADRVAVGPLLQPRSAGLVADPVLGAEICVDAVPVAGPLVLADQRCQSVHFLGHTY